MEQVTTDAPQVLVVTGMSGAGRSSAAKILEDLRYTVIDNLPPALLELAVQSHDIPEVHEHMAVVIDSRGGLPTAELQAAIIRCGRPCHRAPLRGEPAASPPGSPHYQRVDPRGT
jgi:hypothetical protein